MIILPSFSESYFFLTSFRDIVKYITAFTVGHSLTLIFATFNGIQINYYAIDAVIALSVCYIAFVNIDGFRKYLNINPPNMMLMIFSLGLIHSFGLSTRLQQLPLSKDELLMNIISFNVGVELGQISALALMLIFLTAFRKSNAFKTFSQLANYGLILAGALLFLMQMHGFTHSRHPDEFLPEDLHALLESNNSAGTTPVSTDHSQKTVWKDTITITIPAKGEKEYKLLLEKDAPLEYSWQSNGSDLYFDFHGEPAGDTTGYFESYKESTNSHSSGSLTTPFAGTHGWYWKNKTASAVDIELKINGEYGRLD